MEPALSAEAHALNSALAHLNTAKAYVAKGQHNPGLLKALDAAQQLGPKVLRNIRRGEQSASKRRLVRDILTRFEFIANVLGKTTEYAGELGTVGRKITELRRVKRSLETLPTTKMTEFDELFGRISTLPTDRLAELAAYIANLTSRTAGKDASPGTRMAGAGKLALVVSNDTRSEAKPPAPPEISSEWLAPTVARVLEEWPNVSSELLGANLRTALDAVRLGRSVIVGTALRELTPSEVDELKEYARPRQWKDRQRLGYAWETSPTAFIQNQYSDWIRRGMRRANLRAADETLIKRLEKFESDHDITDSILPAQGAFNGVVGRDLLAEAVRAADRDRKRRRRLETKDPL